MIFILSLDDNIANFSHFATGKYALLNTYASNVLYLYHFIHLFRSRLVRRRRTPPPGDFATPNAAGTPPAYIGVRRVFCDLKINFLFMIISEDSPENY